MSEKALTEDRNQTKNPVFGFIWTQPIHKTLRQMRLATIIMLAVSIDIMYRLVAILEKGGTLSPEQTVGAVGVLAGGMFAIIWKGINNLSEPHKSDD